VSFSYSDGFGREIQKKIQAEPGPLDPHDNSSAQLNPRWVGSGWTVFNNKGKPVRQYEPFFSATQDFEFGVIQGVSPVLFYDPADRVVATLHPNHTYEKVVFDPWQQTSYDVNDTCDARNVQTGDPRTDPDIGGVVEEYFKTQPPSWQTWHDQRIGNALGTHERQAAERAAAHADTPTTAHFDALGRPFMTVARNRVVCAGHALDGTEESFATRVALDIEGNQRSVHDERKLPVNQLPTGLLEQRIVMRYAYDMLGNRIHQLSMEAGARWMLGDATGKPIRAWDSRGHIFTTTYDELRRPVGQTVRGTTAESDPRTLNRDILVDKIEYGEPPVNANQAELDRALRLNLRSRIYRHSDTAGVATNARLDAGGNPVEAFDFKGNLLRSTRRLISDYKAIPDWLLNPQLEAESFEGSTRYDALNRPIQSIAPHSSLGRGKFNVIQPVFNEANLLERVDVWLERGAEPGDLLDANAEAPARVGVANIDYDAKGQRQYIDYKNGATTLYSYDPLTLRLIQLLTKRKTADFPGDDPQVVDPNWPGQQVQNLLYTYDPAGNITHIQDDTQQAIYFKNKRVEPSNDYTYDALYRLIQASGREHLGQGAAPLAHSHNDADRVGLLSADAGGRFSPNDGSAMGSYIERYVYDAVGNFLQMQHRGSDPAHPGWTRRYAYNETSLVEGGKQSNRLSSTQVGNGVTSAPEAYQHDTHGNIVRMPHLGAGLQGSNMHWDYKDQLRQTDLGGGGAAHYVNDASGQRVRKVWEKSPGLTEERIYLGGFEIFRKHAGPIGPNTASLERETLHTMDDKQRIALVETRTLDTAGDDEAPRQLIRYPFGNHLGSATLELDERTQVISYEEYSPYGSSTYQAVRSQTETAKRYRYTGKERDEETGLYYHGARLYAPWLGRWSACDPGGMQDEVNVYVYVGNSPPGAVDPNGKWKVNWKHVAIGAGVAVLTVGAVALTAGAAAPALPFVAGALGVSEGTLATGLVVAGTAMGVRSTTTTVSELATGKDASTGKELTDEQASQKLGALPVEVLATVLGAKSIKIKPGGGPSLPVPNFSRVPAFAGGPSSGVAPIRLPTVSAPPMAVPLGAAAGATTLVSPILATTGSGSGGSGGSKQPSKQDDNDKKQATKPKDDSKSAAAPPAKPATSVKGDAGKIHGVDQYRGGQTVVTAEVRMPDGKVIKVAAPNEGAGWRPEQKEMATKLGYRPLDPSTPGSGMHAEEELEAFRAVNKATVLRWGISRGRGGNSVVCDGCSNVTKSWGPQER
jgi:RHS repeat-associated protein